MTEWSDFRACMYRATADLGDVPIDWFTNPWGWPTQFGLGDEAACHPVDPDHSMIWIQPRGTVAVWDERLQLEYAVEAAR